MLHELPETELALPPKTSSPMIRHAAVWIVRAKFCSAVVEDAMVSANKRVPVDAFGAN